MPDWFLIAVFFTFYALFAIVMAFLMSMIIVHLVNIAWILIRKLFPSLPEDKEEYYEQALERGTYARAELRRLSDGDEYQPH